MSVVDNPEFKRTWNPEAWWIIRYFIRDRYIDVEVQAPNEHYAKMFASRCLIMDGIPPRMITGIGAKRINEPTNPEELEERNTQARKGMGF